MTYQPRPYQAAGVQAIYNYFAAKSGNPIVAMPTGTGKSHVIGDFIKSIYDYYPGQRVMMLTHVKELISQNVDKLLRTWPTAPVGIYSAGLKRRDTFCPITFGGIASVAKKAHLFGHQNLIIIDECHLVSPKAATQYQTFISDLKEINPALKVIGLSATPYRLGVGCLTDGGLFTDICYDLTTLEEFNKLVVDGFLAPLVTKKTGLQYDVSDVKIHGGEYVQKQLQIAVDKDELTHAAVREIITCGQDRRHWLVFAAGIEHAEHVRDCFESFGIAAVAIHSKMKNEERDAAIADFVAGKYRVAVNNNILTTGFDFPGIDLIGMLRPTSSTVLWVQALGRGTRPSADTGKTNCLVLDFAGNTRRLGPVNDPVLPRKKGSKGGGTAPVKVCEKCDTYNHASVRVCVECGAVFPKNLKIRHTAYLDEVMASSAPQVATFQVDRVTYERHQKQGRPPSVRITYYCGLRRFRDWFCPEHKGYAGKKARDWWRERADSEPPPTVAEAIPLLPNVRTPLSISVWHNRKYPEVTGYKFY